MNIHPTAIVDPGAELGPEVEIGPYSLIGPHVVIGARCRIGPHVNISGHTTLGDECVVHTGAVLGDAPQDHKYHHEVSYLTIGHRNVIREYVTMHLAVGEGNATLIGDDNLFMAYAHIGHNCVVAHHVTMCNYVGLSGGCRIEERVVLGGMAGLHQFVHVGRMVMVGGHCKVAHDVPPFVLVDGPSQKLYGLNTVGLRRAGFSTELRQHLRKAFRLVCHDTGNLSEALKTARQQLPDAPEIVEFLHFMERSGRSGRHLDPGNARCTR